jgi:hypothetical protein
VIVLTILLRIVVEKTLLKISLALTVGFTHRDTEISRKNKLRGLSPRANYTDRATAACRQSQCQLLRIEGCHVVSAADPYGRNFDFLDRRRYSFFQTAPQLYSLG